MNFPDLKFIAARGIYSADAFSAEKFSREGDIAIILQSEEEDVLKPFLKLQKDLTAEAKNVRILICKGKNSENVNFEYPSFGVEDIRWNGKIENEEVLNFLRTRFQMLICFAAPENKSAAFIVSVADAELKLGLSQVKEGKDLYDVSICQAEPEADVFVEEIKKYIKILNNKAV